MVLATLAGPKTFALNAYAPSYKPKVGCCRAAGRAGCTTSARPVPLHSLAADALFICGTCSCLCCKSAQVHLRCLAGRTMHWMLQAPAMPQLDQVEERADSPLIGAYPASRGMHAARFQVGCTGLSTVHCLQARDHHGSASMS